MASSEKRAYLSQSDVPRFGLSEAQRVARAIADHFGKNPTRPLRVAQALNMQPQSSRFRTLCGAAIAYGMTEGGSKAQDISLTPLGKRIVAPTVEGDDLAASREAFMRPRVIGDFLTRYDGSKLPREDIGYNVLGELGVPDERAEEVLALIVEGADVLGLLREVKGSQYVDLHGASRSDEGVAPRVPNDPPLDDEDGDEQPDQVDREFSGSEARGGKDLGKTEQEALSRVFITHGKDTGVVNQLKELLTFGGFTPVVAQENQTSSIPVPDKVMDDMRSCGAGIIHLGTERRVLDEDGKEHRMLNQNVLIEIGAAMALYGRRFILLVEEGTKLPSNLLGLYEVRYEGGKLDYEATMKLLKAFNDFRK